MTHDEIKTLIGSVIAIIAALLGIKGKDKKDGKE